MHMIMHMIIYYWFVCTNTLLTINWRNHLRKTSTPKQLHDLYQLKELTEALSI
jgi:hypothetical protein